VSYKIRNLILPIIFVCAPTVLAEQPSGQMLATVKHAVVIVTTYDERGKPLFQGSGFFIATDCIVTNAHVIKQASLIRVKTFSGKMVNIQRVIASDASADLALLQTDTPCPRVTPLEVDYSTPVEGEPITVVSNPQGSHWKTTQGQIGTTWEFQDSGRRIQINASVLPGSSGGPVVNQNGRVIGIAVAHTASADDLNFAIPAESLRTLLPAKLAMLYPLGS
jgi:serine protease Do